MRNKIKIDTENRKKKTKKMKKNLDETKNEFKNKLFPINS